MILLILVYQNQNLMRIKLKNLTQVVILVNGVQVVN